MQLLFKACAFKFGFQRVLVAIRAESSIVQGFSIFFQNNTKLIEMISVCFNTTLDGYYQDELGSSNCFNFFFYRKEDKFK